jgi:hypothetical protein
MSQRFDEEVALVRSAYPDLEVKPDGWARIPAYPCPEEIWGLTAVEVAFSFPAGLPGQPPYAFLVRPGLTRPGGVDNYSYPVTVPGFGEGWGQFSWSPEDWRPGPDVKRHSNMLDFVRSFAERLAQGK